MLNVKVNYSKEKKSVTSNTHTHKFIPEFRERWNVVWSLITLLWEGESCQKLILTINITKAIPVTNPLMTWVRQVLWNSPTLMSFVSVVYNYKLIVRHRQFLKKFSVKLVLDINSCLKHLGTLACLQNH